jgi:hypothetical protein
MGAFDLLEAVQPKDGWFAVVGISRSGKVRQIFVETREELDSIASQMDAKGLNMFFGVAKFKDDSTRAKQNVQTLKAFWLDVDCGTDKPYADQDEGLAALRNFTEVTGLPRPAVVNSGRGLHVYWPLEEEITREEWEPVAARLHAVCQAQEFHVDAACFEVSRILRIPGTHNYKGDTPLRVEVMAKPKRALGYEELRDILGVKERPMARAGRPMSALGQQLRDNISSSFSKIMARDPGCAQINAAIKEREDLSEPRWFAALSIAKFCKDKESAIHILSADHPDYDYERTEQKIAHILGPNTCTEFEKHNPGLCKSCPHAGKFKSPIALGREVEVATEEDNVVVEGDEDDEDAVLVTYTIPEYPFPFVRGKNGGIYRSPPPDAEDTTPVLIYERDFYIVKRMRDPQLGGVVLMRLHTPKDGVREFVVPNAKIMDTSELRKEMAAHDVVTSQKAFGFLVEYVVASVKALQEKDKAEHMRNQFGWADNDSKFIIGDREVSADGTYHSPPSSATAVLAEHMVPSGSMEKWQEVFDLYGRQGLEAHAFAAATAFGAPLLKYSGQSGAIINLIHPRSGTGKTTILHMCNSVWGSPKGLCAKKDDTFNSKVHKTGVFNNLPICFDEMSNTEPKQLSELAYLITQGTGKDRMRGSSNELRMNLTSWQTIALCSSNHSFYEKLEGLKDSPEGELMRIIEYHLDYSTTLEMDFAKEMFDHQLMENYGHAGEIYARYLLANRKEAQSIYATIQRRIDAELKLTQRERFWSATVAANIAGIYLAKNAGICNWNLSRVFKWACKMILSLRTTTTPPPENEKQVIGEFILAHMSNILVIKDAVDRRSNMKELPILEPRGDLMVRYETDTKQVLITVRSFRTYCQHRSVSYRETLRKLGECGLYIKTGQKRMTKGTSVVSPPVPVLIFNAEHPDFLSIDDLIPAKAVEEEAA